MKQKLLALKPSAQSIVNGICLGVHMVKRQPCNAIALAYLNNALRWAPEHLGTIASYLPHHEAIGGRIINVYANTEH